MIRTIVFTILLIGLMALAYPQNALRDDLNGVYYDPNLYIEEYETKDGSPYLNLDFTPAKIGNREKAYLVRLNAYMGTIEVWIKENQVIVLDNSRKEKVMLLDGSKREYVIGDFKSSKGEVIQGFLEIIECSDAYILYKRETIKYFKKTKAGAYAPAKPAQFEQANDQFYLKCPDDQMPSYLSNNKKKFMAVFEPKAASKIKMLMKKEHLSLDKEEDMLQILDAMFKN